MAVSADKKRFMVTISKETADKLSFYAKKLDKSDAEFMASVLESAATDDAWIYDVLTSKYFKPVKSLIQYFEDKKTRKGKEPKTAVDGA